MVLGVGMVRPRIGSETSKPARPSRSDRRRRFGLVGGLALFLALLPRPGHAAPGGKEAEAAAETLFLAAKKLMDAKQFAEACPKLEESQRLDPAAGTALNLGECYERVGRTASAWSSYREAAGLARTAGQADREKGAQKRAEALEGKLAHLLIVVPPSALAAGLEIKRDGVIIGQPLWGVATPVDPGSHLVEASAPNKVKWATTIVVKDQQSTTATIQPLVDAPGKAAAQTTGPSPGTSASPPPPAGPPPEPTSDGKGRRLAGIVLGGVGVVGIGVGTIFGLSARSKRDEAKSQCHDGNLCTAAGVDLRDQAFSKATISTVAFGVGGAALVGGVVLYVTAPSPSPAQTSVWLRPRLTPGGADWTVGGAF